MTALARLAGPELEAHLDGHYEDVALQDEHLFFVRAQNPTRDIVAHISTGSQKLVVHRVRKPWGMIRASHGLLACLLPCMSALSASQF